MHLKDLPVKFNLCDEVDVGKTYVTELAAVTTGEELKAFVQRWVALFYLDALDGECAEAVQSIKDGTFDADEALECIAANRKDVCKHFNVHSCPGIHIAIPSILIKSFLAARHYKVPVNVALVQLCGGSDSGYWDAPG